MTQASVRTISVIVPKNVFAPPELQNRNHCLCALDVEKLMEWWPGMPHSPHRNPDKVHSIQRSLDWKRVAQIAAYLLQREIAEVPDRLREYFKPIYGSSTKDPGRVWPPKVSRVIGYERSEFPTFSNVLLHVNGASIKELVGDGAGTARLIFDERDKNLNFTVMDGQHRINGAYFAIKIMQELHPLAKWEIPAEVFLDLDAPGQPPRRQAQIFIDVNFYQKKVDRSLVADLFPTARGPRGPLDDKERAQDIGRLLMLETGPLVGMIQIPGIRYGVKDVVALATLNSGIKDVLPLLQSAKITDLDSQTAFLSQVLTSWLEATGRFESQTETVSELDPQNVVYQGRILVSVLTLVPAVLWKLQKQDFSPVSDKASKFLAHWFRGVADSAGLLRNGKFLSRTEFKERRYLGAGGIGRFRESLWACIFHEKIKGLSQDAVAQKATENRVKILKILQAPVK